MQDNSALHLINAATLSDTAAATALAAQKAITRVPTIKELLAQQQFTYLNQSWGSDAVSDTTREAYIELGRSYSVGKGNSSTGKAVWVSLNMMRYHAGLDLLLNPPRFREKAAVLPDYSLTATVSSAGVFTLRVVPDTDFSQNKIMVSATNALTAGTMSIRSGLYQVLEVNNTLLQAGVSVAPSWLDCYKRAPHVGTRIGVSLTPVTPMGFLGAPLNRSVVVTALTGE